MKKRVQQTVRQIGWIDGLWYACSLLVRAASKRRWRLFKYYIVAQPVATSSLCRGRGTAITVRELAHGELSAAQFDRPAHVISSRYSQGAQCLGAFRDAELAGYLWFAVGAYEEDEVRARFTPASAAAAWDFDVQVFPKHQFGLTFPRLWDEANQRLHGRGVRWSCSRISAFNAASRSSHKRLGARQLGSAVFLCCGDWQWTLASMAPYVHLSRNQSQAPQFSLTPPDAAH